MPWHDVHMAVCGEAAHDLSRHLGQSWNHHARTLVNNVRDHDTYTFFIPQPRWAPPRRVRSVVKHWQPTELQLMRSVSVWSNECDTEASIHTGYIQAIKDAKHFIYIEQQFLVSSMGQEGSVVQNQVGMALYDKLHAIITANHDLECKAQEAEERAQELDAMVEVAMTQLALASRAYTASRAEALSILEIDVTPQKGKLSPDCTSNLGEKDEFSREGHALRRMVSARQFSEEEVDALRQGIVVMKQNLSEMQMKFLEENVEGESAEAAGEMQSLEDEINKKAIEYRAAYDAQCLADAEQFHTRQLEMVEEAKEQARALRAGKKKFRVICVLPLWPNLEGEIWNNTVIQNLMHLQYSTICRGELSILGRLARDFPMVDLAEYIDFYNMRSHMVLNGRPVCEQVYIHSKVVIVDDRVGIIGSANINDRSLLGDRDSEVCVYIGPGDHPPSPTHGIKPPETNAHRTIKCNGEPWEASDFLHSLRVRLWAEHLGMLDEAELSGSRITHEAEPFGQVPQHARALLQDAVEAYDQVWVPIAAKNTVVYEAVFPEMPSNDKRTLEDIKAAAGGQLLKQNIYEMSPTFDTEKAVEYLNETQGNVTRMPLDFLLDYDLKLSVWKDAAKNLVPTEVFS